MIDRVRRDIIVIASELRTALQRETATIIEIGNLLLEAQDQLEHGEWLPWLKEHFGSSERTAYNYMNAAKFTVKFATVANLKLKPTALYYLGNFMESIPLDELEVIFKAAETEWLDDDDVITIQNSIHEERNRSAREEEQLQFGSEAMRRAAAELARAAADARAERSEADDILDGPPPDLPPAPPPTVTDFTLQSFDEALTTLLRVYTKPLSNFMASRHSAVEISSVSDFLRALCDAKIKKSWADIGKEPITLELGAIPKDQEALEWNLTYRSHLDGREGFDTKAGRGHYKVDPVISTYSHYYQAKHVIGGKERIVTPRSIMKSEFITTADQAKKFAQCDWEQEGAEERTRKEPQPVTIAIRKDQKV